MRDGTVIDKEVEMVLSDFSTWEGEVDDARDYAEAAILLQKVEGMMKRIGDYYEEDRNGQFVEYQKVLVEINMHSLSLNRAEYALRKKICQYLLNVDQKIAHEPDVQAVLATAFPETMEISLVEVWDFEITDAEAIPREFLTVNERKIAATVQEMKELADIPGIRVTGRKSVRPRHLQR